MSRVLVPPPPPPMYPTPPMPQFAQPMPRYVMPPPPPPPPLPMPAGYPVAPMQRAGMHPTTHRGRYGASRPMHEPMRVEVRGRNGEILTRNNRTNERQDQFELPRDMMKPGWSYQWVTVTCYNKETPANVNLHMENGWRPVPATDKPGWFHPVEYNGAIMRDGLMLMERPQVLTDQAVMDGVAAAKRQQHNQSADFAGVEKMLDQTGGTKHAFVAPDRAHDMRGVAAPKLIRTVEGVPDAFYPSRQLAMGDED